MRDKPAYKEKVLAYITRQKPEGRQLLVFDHRDYPEAGVQVPAGTVDSGEGITAALLREVYEESGLEFKSPGISLGQFEWFREDRNEMHNRNVFHLSLPANAPDEWIHLVKGQDEDNGMAFRYYWISLDAAHKILAAEQGAYLGEIRVDLNESY